jgi:hypothetical protein
MWYRPLGPHQLLDFIIGDVGGLCPEWKHVLYGKVFVERFQRRIAIRETVHVAWAAHINLSTFKTIEPLWQTLALLVRQSTTRVAPICFIGPDAVELVCEHQHRMETDDRLCTA